MTKVFDVDVLKLFCVFITSLKIQSIQQKTLSKTPPPKQKGFCSIILYAFERVHEI